MADFYRGADGAGHGCCGAVIILHGGLTKGNAAQRRHARGHKVHLKRKRAHFAYRETLILACGPTASEASPKMGGGRDGCWQCHHDHHSWPQPAAQDVNMRFSESLPCRVAGFEFRVDARLRKMDVFYRGADGAALWGTGRLLLSMGVPPRGIPALSRNTASMQPGLCRICTSHMPAPWPPGQ